MIHYPRQPPDNYIFWPRVYAKALGQTIMTLPHSMSNALLARCYGYISAYGRRTKDEEEAERKADLEGFVLNWIGLRALHGNMFGTTAYLAIVDKSLPIVGEIAFAMREDVAKLELEMKLLAAEEDRKRQEEGLKRGIEQTATETGEAPVPVTHEEKLQTEEAAMNY